ncbi:MULTISPECIES: ABC transporter permease [Halomonadaceae]|uniref:Transport permease protein n=1 Tax=Vreelandella halophila TaxID=86177 RepID=A0A9X4YC92_9GAMM|nr:MULTISPECIES: ABC transporter permease [Halomonas]MYL25265.1 ABC transporter permease [Halomonas utahensis]MYL75327.1 ABC transporter permease [Halomonas sp. 22501_18_FS]
MGALKALWAYRGFILGSVKREFQSRYLNSLLGAIWTVIQPLSMIVVYTVIFSQILQAKLPGVEHSFGYSIYLCSGIITWGLFLDIINRGQNIFLAHGDLLKKLSFPRLCLPATVGLTALLDFAIIFALFTAFLVVTGTFPGLVYFAVIPVLIVQLVFSMGLGITLGVLNVFFRDVGQAMGVILQFWFWLTPIVYPANIVPESARELLAYNPMVGLMGAYQTIFARAELPDWHALIPVILLGVFFCVAGMRLFRKHSGEIVDEL